MAAKETSIAIVMLLAAACSERPRVLPPHVKLNISPKERYEITLIIESPPAALQIKGRVQYYIKNEDCMPYADRIAGIKPDSTFFVHFPFNKVSQHTYVGYIFADAPQPQDYYGLGLCQWDFTSVKALISVQGKNQTARIPRDDVVHERKRLNFCRRPSNQYEWDFCLSSTDEVLISREKEVSYIVTMASREVSL